MDENGLWLKQNCMKMHQLQSITHWRYDIIIVVISFIIVKIIITTEIIVLQSEVWLLVAAKGYVISKFWWDVS